MKKYLLALLLLATLPIAGQTPATPSKSGGTSEGIVYCLPATTFHVVVRAIKTHYEPGEYRNYAERYLRLKNIPKDSYDTWEIQDIRLEVYATPDRQKTFSVKLRPNTSAPLLRLDEEGTLLSVNAEPLPPAVLTPTSVEAIPNDMPHPEDYKTEEILSAGSTSKMAELTANEIYDIRDNRSALAKGQADFMPKDGEQLRLMLASLDRQEAALLQLFRGSTTQEQHTFVYNFTPTAGGGTDLLFRFSKHLGPVDNDDVAGEPFYITIKNLQGTIAASPADKKDKKDKKDQELHYNLPARASVSIFNNKREYVQATLPIAQMGTVGSLGSALFEKKMKTAILFVPSTGAIAKVIGE